MVVSSVMTASSFSAASLRSDRFVSLSGLGQHEYIPGNALVLFKGTAALRLWSFKD